MKKILQTVSETSRCLSIIKLGKLHLCSYASTVCFFWPYTFCP